MMAPKALFLRVGLNVGLNEMGYEPFLIPFRADRLALFARWQSASGALPRDRELFLHRSSPPSFSQPPVSVTYR